MPFRGDMPDIVLQLLAETAGHGREEGPEPALRRQPGGRDAAAGDAPRRPRAARRAGGLDGAAQDRVLPAQRDRARAAPQRGPAEGVGPRVRAWARIPQAGIAVMGAARAPRAGGAHRGQYARALAWCKVNAAACGKAVAARIDVLSAEAVADSIAVSQLEVVPSRRCACRARAPVRQAGGEESRTGRRQAAGRWLLRRSEGAMNLLRAWLAGLPAYLWSGWGAIASLCLLLAAWEAVSLVHGPLVMPDPRAPSPRCGA